MDRTGVLLGITTFLYCTYLIQGAFDPCKDSKVLPHLTERLEGYEAKENDSMICDISLDEGWYSLGQYVLAEDANATCGTERGWYMADPLPTKSQVVTVCRQQGNDSEPCLYNTTLEVMLCHDGNYVYNLKRLEEAQCNEAYCIKQPSLSKPKIRVEVAEHGQAYQLLFYCDIVPIVQKDYYYVVEWSIITNSTIADKIKCSSEEKFINETHFSSKTVMTEQDLKNFGVQKLGFSVICCVKAKNDKTGVFSQDVSSDPKFCGIEKKEVGPVKLSGPNLEEEVYLRLTVPFGCRNENKSRCQIHLKIFITTTESCKLSQVAIAQSTKTCTITFQANEINKYKPFKVVHRFGENKAIKEYKYRVVQLISMRYLDHQIFSNFIIDPIIVQIKTKPCPNFTNKWKVYCVCAVVIRAGRDIYLIDECDKDSIPRYEFRMCEDKVLKGQVKRMKEQQKYVITLPTGTVVEVLNSWYEFFEVDIIPSAVDINSTEGLCGDFDLDKTNDGHSIYSHQTWRFRTSGDLFDQRKYYRVKISEDLFDQRNYAKLLSYNATIYLCECSHNDLISHNDNLCETTQQRLCRYDSRHIVGDKDMCRVRNKRKRYWNKYFSSQISFSTLPKKNTIPTRNLPSVHAYTKITARDECIKLMNTTIAQMCSDIPNLNIDSYINDCIADAMATSSMDWAKVHLEGFKSKCIYQIQVNQPLLPDALEELKQAKENVKGAYNRLINNNENENLADLLSLNEKESIVETFSNSKFTPELLESVTSLSCPFDCNSHGKCIQGKCVCDSDFIGFDCSVNATKPPHMIGIPDNGLCDKKKRLCTKTSVFAKSLVESETLSCRLESFTIDVNETITTNTSVKTTATLETFSEVSCKLSSRRTRRSLKVLNGHIAYGYFISISNDGELFSEKDTLVIYDSICVDCTKKSQQLIYCKLKTGYCVSDGNCYKKSESIDCMTCTGDLDGTLKWRQRTGCVIESSIGNEDGSKLWILGAVLGPMLCIIIISAFFYRSIQIKRRQKAYSVESDDKQFKSRT